MWIEIKNNEKLETINLEGVMSFSYSKVNDEESELMFQYANGAYNKISGDPATLKDFYEYIKIELGDDFH